MFNIFYINGLISIPLALDCLLDLDLLILFHWLVITFYFYLKYHRFELAQYFQLFRTVMLIMNLKWCLFKGLKYLSVFSLICVGLTL